MSILAAEAATTAVNVFPSEAATTEKTESFGIYALLSTLIVDQTPLINQSPQENQSPLSFPERIAFQQMFLLSDKQVKSLKAKHPKMKDFFFSQDWSAIGHRIKSDKCRRYVFEKGELITGSASFILRVWDLLTDRPLVFKIFQYQTPKSQQYSIAEDRIRQEALFTDQARQSRPHSVPVLNCLRVKIKNFNVDGSVLVLPWFKQGSLYDYFHKIENRSINSANIKIIISLFGDIAEAIEELRLVEPAINHRDLKPGNFLLTNDCRKVFVIDYDVAEGFLQRNIPLNSKLIIGTPQYWDPEKVQGKVTDLRSDVYVLAEIIYFMLIGEELYDDDSSNNCQNLSLQILAGWTAVEKKVGSRINQLFAAYPNVAQEIIDIFKKALDQDLSQRYQTPSELAEAFVQVLKPLALFKVIPVALAV